MRGNVAVAALVALILSASAAPPQQPGTFLTPKTEGAKKEQTDVPADVIDGIVDAVSELDVSAVKNSERIAPIITKVLKDLVHTPDQFLEGIVTVFVNLPKYLEALPFILEDMGLSEATKLVGLFFDSDLFKPENHPELAGPFLLKYTKQFADTPGAGKKLTKILESLEPRMLLDVLEKTFGGSAAGRGDSSLLSFTVEGRPVAAYFADAAKKAMAKLKGQQPKAGVDKRKKKSKQDKAVKESTLEELIDDLEGLPVDWGCDLAAVLPDVDEFVEECLDELSATELQPIIGGLVAAFSAFDPELALQLVSAIFGRRGLAASKHLIAGRTFESPSVAAAMLEGFVATFKNDKGLDKAIPDLISGLDRKALQAVISMARRKGNKSVLLTTKLDGKVIITHVIAEVARKKGKELSKMAAKDQPAKKEQGCVEDVLAGRTTLSSPEDVEDFYASCIDSLPSLDFQEAAVAAVFVVLDDPNLVDGPTEEQQELVNQVVNDFGADSPFITAVQSSLESIPAADVADFEEAVEAAQQRRRRRRNRTAMATMCDFLDAPELIANKAVEDYVDCLIAANKTYEAEVLVLSILDLPKSIALDSFAEELFKVLGLKDAEELLVDLLKLPEDMLLEKLSAEAVETLVETLIVTFEAETGFEELCTVVLGALNKVLPQPTSLTCSLSDTAGEKKGGKDKKGKPAKKATKGGKARKEMDFPCSITEVGCFLSITNNVAEDAKLFGIAMEFLETSADEIELLKDILEKLDPQEEALFLENLFGGALDDFETTLKLLEAVIAEEVFENDVEERLLEVFALELGDLFTFDIAVVTDLATKAGLREDQIEKIVEAAETAASTATGRDGGARCARTKEIDAPEACGDLPVQSADVDSYVLLCLVNLKDYNPLLVDQLAFSYKAIKAVDAAGEDLRQALVNSAFRQLGLGANQASAQSLATDVWCTVKAVDADEGTTRAPEFAAKFNAWTQLEPVSQALLDFSTLACSDQVICRRSQGSTAKKEDTTIDKREVSQPTNKTEVSDVSVMKTTGDVTNTTTASGTSHPADFAAKVDEIARVIKAYLEGPCNQVRIRDKCFSEVAKFVSSTVPPESLDKLLEAVDSVQFTVSVQYALEGIDADNPVVCKDNKGKQQKDKGSKRGKEQGPIVTIPGFLKPEQFVRLFLSICQDASCIDTATALFKLSDLSIADIIEELRIQAGKLGLTDAKIDELIDALRQASDAAGSEEKQGDKAVQEQTISVLIVLMISIFTGGDGDGKAIDFFLSIYGLFICQSSGGLSGFFDSVEAKMISTSPNQVDDFTAALKDMTFTCPTDATAVIPGKTAGKQKEGSKAVKEQFTIISIFTGANGGDGAAIDFFLGIYGLIICQSSGGLDGFMDAALEKVKQQLLPDQVDAFTAALKTMTFTCPTDATPVIPGKTAGKQKEGSKAVKEQDCEELAALLAGLLVDFMGNEDAFQTLVGTFRDTLPPNCTAEDFAGLVEAQLEALEANAELIQQFKDAFL
ncbi:unnamed protein product [Vitrella brassicaformis CCMP3155]|uniref:MI domain-containing protein n=1 Tax=Vitrella brassicaformis (strain CCMP3155) TaxID=1169540 RepID=A0A0G4EYN9_VITBC|nr:unnamed protein product [Vitrella brassicaformis CCMP3155]|eukprot:CEM04479.1 unnamed protein product [Vitrella brassicaformis CCMP3155]